MSRNTDAIPSADDTANLQQLVQLVNTHTFEDEKEEGSASRKKSHKSLIMDLTKEQQSLDTFLRRFSKAYIFKADIFNQLFRALLTHRLLRKTWNRACTKEHLLRVLQTIRVLTRDTSLAKVFVQMQSLEAIAALLTQFTTHYFQKADKDSSAAKQYTDETIIEISSILKRLASDQATQRAMFTIGVHKSLVLLLSARHAVVLQAVLVTLLNMSSCPTFSSELLQLNAADPLLRLVHDSCSLSPPFPSYRTLSGQLLDLLLQDAACRVEVASLGGNSTLLRILPQLGRRDPLLPCICRALNSMAIDLESARQIRFLGGIPLLLTSIAISQDSRGSVLPPPNVVVAILDTLTQLSLDDHSSHVVRKLEGVYTTGQLLLSQHSNSNSNDNYSSTANSSNNHSSSSSSSNEVPLHALRLLRFLYSTEKNRGVFKSLFPPDLFATFIDIGNYCSDLGAYKPMLAAVLELPWNRTTRLIAAFEATRNEHREIRKIRDFVILETLGKGAFGVVFQVKRQHSPQVYALKELPLKHSSADPAQLKQEVAAICKEVEIISKLEHPHIVKYHDWFVGGSNLYILMEHVEGASLASFLTAVQEKRQRLPEEKIWTIFIQLILALSYLHVEKRVVHRDLTPANIMVDQQGKRDRVKIADFGLARQQNSSSVVMKSVVGTISYSCPEIVMHQSYTMKADIWSLGCLLYQLAMLSPPFSGNNPLTVAQKIVEGQYEPIGSHYSPLLSTIVGKLLCTNPDQRPDIIQVSSLVAPLLMAELDRVNMAEMRLEGELLAAVAEKADNHDSDGSERASSNSPVEDALVLVHKLTYIANLPPSTHKQGGKRAAVMHYYHSVFRRPPSELHRELRALAAGGGEVVGALLHVSLSRSSSSGNGAEAAAPGEGGSRARDSRITYGGLGRILEEVLEKSGYYVSPCFGGVRESPSSAGGTSSSFQAPGGDSSARGGSSSHASASGGGSAHSENLSILQQMRAGAAGNNGASFTGRADTLQQQFGALAVSEGAVSSLDSYNQSSSQPALQPNSPTSPAPVAGAGPHNRAPLLPSPLASAVSIQSTGSSGQQFNSPKTGAETSHSNEKDSISGAALLRQPTPPPHSSPSVPRQSASNSRRHASRSSRHGGSSGNSSASGSGKQDTRANQEPNFVPLPSSLHPSTSEPSPNTVSRGGANTSTGSLSSNSSGQLNPINGSPGRQQAPKQRAGKVGSRGSRTSRVRSRSRSTDSRKEVVSSRKT